MNVMEVQSVLECKQKIEDRVKYEHFFTKDVAIIYMSACLGGGLSSIILYSKCSYFMLEFGFLL